MIPSYSDLYHATLSEGLSTPSRMGDTLELLGATVEYPAGEMVSRRGINDALGFMELMQIAAGIFDVEQIKRVAPRADHSLFTEQMAYGPRLRGQMSRAIEALRADPLSRQVAVYIGGREDGPTANLPCTSTLQWLLRDGRVHCIATMRSWDITRGLAYDIMFQGGLTMLVARCLGVLPGLVRCTAGSLHLYASEAHKTPSDRQRRFEFNESVPREWPAVEEWAHLQVYQMERVPAGVEVREG